MVSQARRDDGTFGKPMPRDPEANGLRKEGEKAGCVPVSQLHASQTVVCLSGGDTAREQQDS